MTNRIVEEKTSRSQFHSGDLALLIDRKGRRYLLTLKEEGTFHTHLGSLAHSQIIGRQEGEWFSTTHGQLLLALKPTLADYVQEMDRVTQVIYPKDLGAIVQLADIFPGARVVEAGFGSGALTLALLRAVGEQGSVTSYELRSGQADRALENIRPLMPHSHTLTIKELDIYQGIEESEVDRLVLDVPEPWQAVPAAAEALVPGGILLSFLPTILQVHHLVEALSADPCFQLIETVEVILRPWHVTKRSVRPVHRMVAHTGFITTTRKCTPRPGARVTSTTDRDEQEDG